MIKNIASISFILLIAIFLVNASAQEDEEGCYDHPLFSRMPNFYLGGCKIKEYDQMDFIDEKENDIVVEGKLHEADYWIKEGFQAPSELQIIRNYKNAVLKIGGKVVKEYSGEIYLTLSKDNKLYWINIDTANEGGAYDLRIMEKAEMTQDIIANADAIYNDILTTGHASIYGIYFDFNKSEIKPESEPAIKEIAKMLAKNKNIKIYIVGHTDNVGTIDYNMKLSQARAESVANELTIKYKIESQRIKAYGVASLAPVSPNTTEEGRAKNRRVEIVQQ